MFMAVKELPDKTMEIRYNAELIADSKKDDVLTIVDAMSLASCDFIGETYALNNQETGHTVYSYLSDLVYIFPWAMLELLEQGETVTLTGVEPNEWEREYIND